MSDVWIVLLEDRHVDVDAFPFTSEAAALDAARRLAGEWTRHDDPVEAELTPDMINDRWVLLLEYGTEGDHVTVIRRTLDAGTA